MNKKFRKALKDAYIYNIPDPKRKEEFLQELEKRCESRARKKRISHFPNTMRFLAAALTVLAFFGTYGIYLNVTDMHRLSDMYESSVSVESRPEGNTDSIVGSDDSSTEPGGNSDVITAPDSVHTVNGETEASVTTAPEPADPDTSHTTVGVSNTSADVSGSVNTQPQETTGPKSEQSSNAHHNTESMLITQTSEVEATHVPDTGSSHISINVSFSYGPDVSCSVSVSVHVSISVSQSVSVSVSLSTSESTTSSSSATTVLREISVSVKAPFEKRLGAVKLYCFLEKQYKCKLL